MSDENNKKKVTTVQSAMDYVDTPVSNFSSWKVKDLGLQFLLFGMAELSAKRAIRLQGYIADLEEVVFEQDIIRELQPKDVLNAYKLASEINRDNLDFIARTRKEMDWNSVNEQLAILTTSDSEQADVDLKKMANKLIEAMKNNKKESADE